MVFPEEEPADDFAIDDLEFVPAEEDLADEDLADEDLAEEPPALLIDFEPDAELAALGLGRCGFG